MQCMIGIDMGMVLSSHQVIDSRVLDLVVVLLELDLEEEVYLLRLDLRRLVLCQRM